MDINQIVGAWSWGSVPSAAATYLQGKLEPVLEDLAKRAGEAAAKKIWENVTWSRATNAYLRKLLPSVETTRVLGYSKPISITQIYTDVLVFKDTGAFQRATLELNSFGTLHAHEDRFEKLPGKELALTGKSLFITGRPGAGKTTFLKHLALLACKGEISKTPIYIPLRDLENRGSPDLFDAIAIEFTHCNIPDPALFSQSLLLRGDAILLLDGLDEVKNDNGFRSRIISGISSILRRFPRAQVCVTCRVAATEYSFEHLTYAEVSDFSHAQQASFISKWFEYDRKRSELFLSQWNLQSAIGLRELARTPLLLTMICLSFEDSLNLPLRRVDIFEDAIAVLVRRWDTTRNIERSSPLPNIKRHRYEHLFCQIASASFDAGQILFSNVFAEKQISDWVQSLPPPEGREVSKEEAHDFLVSIEANTGILVNRARNIYSFSHLTIQEFFIAKSWMDGHNSISKRNRARKLLDAPRWREVFLFACEMTGDATDLIRTMAAETETVLRRSPRLLELHQIAIDVSRTETDWIEAARQVASAFASRFENTDFPAARVDNEGNRSVVSGLLRRTYECIPKDQFLECRSVLAILTNVSISHWGNVGLALVQNGIGDTPLILNGIRYGDYLRMAQLTIECALRASCRERENQIWRAIGGGLEFVKRVPSDA